MSSDRLSIDVEFNGDAALRPALRCSARIVSLTAILSTFAMGRLLDQ
jgi:hypothetical protein